MMTDGQKDALRGIIREQTARLVRMRERAERSPLTYPDVAARIRADLERVRPALEALKERAAHDLGEDDEALRGYWTEFERMVAFVDGAEAN